MWPNPHETAVWSHLQKKSLMDNFIFCAVNYILKRRFVFQFQNILLKRIKAPLSKENGTENQRQNVGTILCQTVRGRGSNRLRFHVNLLEFPIWWRVFLSSYLMIIGCPRGHSSPKLPNDRHPLQFGTKKWHTWKISVKEFM